MEAPPYDAVRLKGRSRLRIAAAATVAVVAACGGGGGGSSAAPVGFVGNSTCSTDGQQTYSPSPPNTNGRPAVGQAVDEMPHVHVTPPTHVTYNHNPPTSGCHYNIGYGTAPV